jgi:aryl-alcohol dehydrogenase-like predicted oxidoreductase
MVNLVLGTAQLGLDYGVTNITGRPSDSNAASMLDLAKHSSITTLDTAIAYGDADLRLSEVGFAVEFDVISKFQCIQGKRFFLEPHLKRLNLPSIYGMLFHNSSQIASATGKQNLDDLRAFKGEGLVSKIGFSAYQIDEIEEALDYFPDPDIIQIPSHALDFRALDSNILTDLNLKGVEIHVRSVLLQGLLIAEPKFVLNGQHSFLFETLGRIAREAEVTNQTVLQYVINQVRNHPNVSSIVVGANTTEELGDIVTAWGLPLVKSERILHNLDYEYLDPRNWTQGETK